VIHALNHFTVLSSDLDRTLEFYVGALGLEPGPRPDLGFPGAWLYASGQAVLHVVAGRTMPEPRHGVIDHVALSARGLARTKARLEARGVDHTQRRLPGNGPWQIFCEDPDGAGIELQFPADETL